MGRLAARVLALPERVMRREEMPGLGHDPKSSADSGMPRATLKCFVPFKSFFGGWLVYELVGRLWRQYATPKEMRAAGVGSTRAI